MRYIHVSITIAAYQIAPQIHQIKVMFCIVPKD